MAFTRKGRWNGHWWFVCDLTPEDSQAIHQDETALDREASTFFAQHNDQWCSTFLCQLPNLDLMEVTFESERLWLTFAFLHTNEGTALRPPCDECCEDDKCMRCEVA